MCSQALRRFFLLALVVTLSVGILGGPALAQTSYTATISKNGTVCTQTVAPPPPSPQWVLLSNSNGDTVTWKSGLAAPADTVTIVFPNLENPNYYPGTPFWDSGAWKFEFDPDATSKLTGPSSSPYLTPAEQRDLSNNHFVNFKYGTVTFGDGGTCSLPPTFLGVKVVQ